MFGRPPEEARARPGLKDATRRLVDGSRVRSPRGRGSGSVRMDGKVVAVGTTREDGVCAECASYR